MSYSDSTFHGPVVASAENVQQTLNFVYNFPSGQPQNPASPPQAPTAERPPPEELAEQLLKDVGASRAWEETVDRMEDAGLHRVDPCDMVTALEGLSGPERSLVTGGPPAERLWRLETVLRWRHDLHETVPGALAAVGHEAVWTGAAAAQRTLHPSSSVFNLPRLRLAVLALRRDVNNLPASFCNALLTADCLQPPELRNIKKKKDALSAVLEKKSEDEMRIFRCLLLLDKPELHYKLLREYLDISADCSTFDKFREGVPALPAHHVHRRRLEAEIEKWMTRATNGSQQLLLLWGMGSAGKTVLSTFASHQALQTGFHRVVWFQASKPQADFDSAVRRTAELTEMGDRVLLIVDDALDDTMISRVSEQVAIIASSRKETIGEHTTRSEQRRVLRVTGLEREEAATLLSLVLGELDQQLQSDMRARAHTLIAASSNMPLMANLVGSLLRRDHCRWADKGLAYFDELEAELREAQKRLRAASRRTRGTDYPHPTVPAALFVSVQHLAEEERNKYELLAAFGPRETILPLSASAVWEEGEASARALLRRFSECSLLVHRGYSRDVRDDEFVLHDLMLELLEIVLEEGGRHKEVRVAAVKAYRRRAAAGRVEERDRFFYGAGLVRLCLKADQAEAAAEWMRRVAYCVTRLRVRPGDGRHLLRDLKEIRVKCCAPEVELEKMERLVSAVVGRPEESDALLRAALAQRDGHRVRDEAMDIVREERYRDWTFFLCYSPLQLSVEPRLLTLQWSEDVSDFIAAWVDWNDEVTVRRLLRSEIIFTSDITDLDLHEIISVSMSKFPWDTDMEMKWKLKQIFDVCYSVSSGHLYALLLEQNDLFLYYLRSGGESPTRLHLKPFMSWKLKEILAARIQKHMPVPSIRNRDQYFSVSDNGAAVVWRFDDTLCIFSLETGECFAMIEGVRGCRMTTDGRRLAVWGQRLPSVYPPSEPQLLEMHTWMVVDIPVKITESSRKHELEKRKPVTPKYTASGRRPKLYPSFGGASERRPSSESKQPPQKTASSPFKISTATVGAAPEAPASAAVYTDKATLLVWDLPSQQCVLSWHGGPVQSASFSPGGEQLACATKSSVLVFAESYGCWEETTRVEGRFVEDLELLSFPADCRRLLLRRGFEILSVDLADGKETLLWNWKWTNYSLRTTPEGISYAANPQATAVVCACRGFDLVVKVLRLSSGAEVGARPS